MSEVLPVGRRFGQPKTPSPTPTGSRPQRAPGIPETEPARASRRDDFYIGLQRSAGNEAVATLIDQGAHEPGGTLTSAARGLALPVQRWTWPWEPDPDPEQDKARIRRLLINPEVNADRVLELIDAADADLLGTIREFNDASRLASMAGSEQGRRVLARVAAKFGKAKQWDLQIKVKEALERHTELEGVTVSKATQDPIDVINHALEGEAGDLAMLYRDWLHLPVKPYRSGAEEDGGVYYDRNLKGKSSSLGQKPRITPARTEAVEWPAEPDKGIPEGRVPLIFIRFGPHILLELTAATDPESVAAANAYIRSAVYHEFQHFLDYRKLRNPEELGDDRRKVTLEANAETRAYASQIWRYYDELSAPQIGNLLTELSGTLPSADDDVRDRAVALIAAAVRTRDLPSTVAHEELLTTLESLTPTAQKALGPLRARVAMEMQQIEAKERLFNSVAQ